MARETPRPTWGWDAPVRIWVAAFGAIAGLGLILGGQTPGGPPPAPPRLIVDPNTAPPAVLLALPRLGPTLVARIVEARRDAPFRSLDDLDARVRGIGPATITALRPFLRIAGSETGTDAIATSVASTAVVAGPASAPSAPVPGRSETEQGGAAGPRRPISPTESPSID